MTQLTESREERNARIRKEKARQIAASLEVPEAAKQIEYLYADGSVTDNSNMVSEVYETQTPKGFLPTIRKIVNRFIGGIK